MHPPTEPPEGDAAGPPVVTPIEPRQRWRLTYRRAAVPAELVGRPAIEAWQTALLESGLTLAQLDATGRPRLAFGAPLPAAAEGEAELAELFLAERVPAWRVREGLASRLPAGHTLISAEDVWLGAPPLAGRVVAADWRIEVGPAGVDPDRLRSAADLLLAAATLPRTRSKGGADKSYDLRPLVADIQVAAPTDAGSPIGIHVRTRYLHELGSGRPEEVIAALTELCGAELVASRTVRERLVLAGDEGSREPGI